MNSRRNSAVAVRPERGARRQRATLSRLSLTRSYSKLRTLRDPSVFRNKVCLCATATVGSSGCRVAPPASADSVAVDQCRDFSIPVSQLAPMAVGELSMNSTPHFAAVAEPRSADRSAAPRGLRGAVDHIGDPRPPRSPMRSRCNATSKLTQG